MTVLVQLALLVATAEETFEPSAEVLSEFEEAEFRFSGGRYSNELFRYRRHNPAIVKPGQHYPLLVWLHGAKERGAGNRAQMRWLDYILGKLPPSDVDYYVLAIQCPPDRHLWYASGDRNATDASDQMLTIAKAILDETVSTFPIDKRRIYLAGVSSGGSGCWEMAMRYPDLFAGVAPMSSRGGDLSRLERIVDVPIWAFHSQADKPEAVQQTVDALTSLGGKTYLTIIESDPHDLSDWLHKHDCWSAAIREYDVITWLFRQARGAPVVPPPGYEPWTWFHYSAGILVVVGICGGGWFFANRCR